MRVNRQRQDMIFFDWMPFDSADVVVITVAIGVFLTYFYRPIKIEIRKRHSDDLKGLVEEWKAEVPEVLSANEAEKSEPTLLKLPVEKEHLFSDLKNHMPPDLNVLDVWKTFKSEYKEYARKRYRLFKDICDEVANKTGLDFKWKGSNYEWKEGTMSDLYIELIYRDAFNVADNRSKRYDNIGYVIEAGTTGYLLRSRTQVTTLAWGSSKEVVRKAESIHKAMISGLEDSDYVGKAKSLLDDQKALEERREELMIALNGFISIPIFPRNCRYISWSIYGIFMSIKERFYWLKRRF